MADNNEKVFLTEQGVADFATALGTKFVWLSKLFDGNGKILPTLLPDFILGQVMFGGTIDANGIITPSSAYRNRYAGEFANGDVTLDVDSLAASTHEGVYFIASAKGASGVVEPTKLGVEIGDWVISNGQIWTKIDNTDAVKSVANLTGAISAEALRNATLADTANTMWYASAKGVLSSFATTQYGRNLLSAESLTKVVGLFAEKAEKDANGNIITSTYMPLAGGTFTGDVTHKANLILANSKVIAGKDTSGSNISLLSLNASNQVVIGYGAHNKYDTLIYGNRIIAYGDICGQKGVSAKGIADFGVGSSSGGNGGAHYDLLVDQKTDRVTLQLKGDDGDIDTKDMLAFSTSRAGIVPNAPSAGSVLRGNGWGTLAFSELASKPTTIGGYGITDAYTKSQIENGVFPNMRVGLADDLGDIEETLDEEYTFQPTANPNEIRDGYAQIESLKGNSLVWNQLVRSNLYSSFGNITYGDDYNTYTITDIGANDWSNKVECEANTIAGHKYLFYTTINASKALATIHWLIESDNNNQAIYHSAFTGTKVISSIITAKSSFKSLNQFQLSFRLANSTYNVGDTIQFKHKVFDLTQMFGEGYEPTTVEEFERRCPKGMPMDYNEGEVIHFNGDLKSVGFNQWDEEWEVGDYNWGTGLPNSNSARWRNKNFIKVIGGYQYFLKSPYRLELLTYDINKNYIETLGWNGGSIRTFNSNVGYINICYASGATYNHDICINLSDPDKNGTYEPYTEFVRELPTDLFDGGMKSAGTAYDEIYWDKAKGKYVKVQRIGKVDLGTLDYVRYPSATGYEFETIHLEGAAYKQTTLISDIYTPIGEFTSDAEMSSYPYGMCMGNNSSIIKFYKPQLANSSISDFKAAMQGVMLYYELAEPIVEEIDIPYMDYQVSNSGTEEIVSDMPTTPIKARVIYNFDTIGTVKQNRFDISTLKTFMPNGIAKQAHKLATPRTIWGQSFDGSGDVSGALIISGTMDSKLILDNTDSENYSAISFRQNGTESGALGVSYGLLMYNWYPVLHSGNTSLSIDDSKDGFTLNVNGNQVGMSAMTKARIEEIVNAALQD